MEITNSVEGSESERVIFILEGKDLICSKRLLMDNSEYFNTMFTGNFIENNLEKVELKEVEYKTMETLEKCLWDAEYMERLDEELLIKLFRVCHMFLVNTLKDLTVNHLRKKLKPSNSIQIWVSAESHQEDGLSKRAKLLSLLEFNKIKDTNCIFHMDINLLCEYLGNIHLHCDKEIDVFYTAIRWYSNVYNTNEQCMSDICKLLHCLDFNSLTVENVTAISGHPIVFQYCDIVNILNCVKSVKLGENIEQFDEISKRFALRLLESTGRDLDGVPCILAEREPSNIITSYYDCYFRKRKYLFLDENSTYSTSTNSNYLSTVYLGDAPFAPNLSVLHPNFTDPQSNILKKLVDIEPNFNGVQGFSIIGYKQFLFIFGGEETIGKGPWKQKGWKYDTVTGESSYFDFPYKRRHFQTCIVGHYLFVIGGFGRFRIYESNIFYYDFEKDEWSSAYILPTENRFIRSCCYQNQLFIFDVDGKSGYTFHPNREKQWVHYRLKAHSTTTTGAYRSRPLFCHNGRIFSYNDGDDLIELKLSGNEIFMEQLVESKVYLHREKSSIVCKDILYNLVDNGEDSKPSISLIKYDIKQKKSSIIFQYNEGAVFEAEANNSNSREYFRMRRNLHLFKFFIMDYLNQLVN